MGYFRDAEIGLFMIGAFKHAKLSPDTWFTYAVYCLSGTLFFQNVWLIHFTSVKASA